MMNQTTTQEQRQRQQRTTWRTQATTVAHQSIASSAAAAAATGRTFAQRASHLWGRRLNATTRHGSTTGNEGLPVTQPSLTEVTSPNDSKAASRFRAQTGRRTTVTSSIWIMTSCREEFLSSMKWSLSQQLRSRRKKDPSLSFCGRYSPPSNCRQEVSGGQNVSFYQTFPAEWFLISRRLLGASCGL